MSPNVQARTQNLEDAFETFNQLSSQLTESYRQLEGRVAGLSAELASTRDARLRELTEKERLANRLALLLDVLPGGVVVLDGEGIVQECNPAAIELLEEPLIGQVWSHIIGRAFAPRADDGHDTSLIDGRRVSISTCPLGSEPGQILLITDVTEKHHLQERLNHQQRLAAMGQTTASLAHQIRTPLSSALLYASNLKRPQLSDADRLRVSEKIFSRLRHLEQLVNNMLMYARGVKVGNDWLAPGRLLTDLELALDAQLSASETRFQFIDETQGGFIVGNGEMILSCMINLCINAIQAMGKQGEITAIASEQLQHIVISIRDNGPGIPAEQKKDIFDPFFTTRKEGTGLGLAVVQAVMSTHQGRVELESQPGEGCTFHLVFPRLEQKEKAETAQRV